MSLSANYPAVRPSLLLDFANSKRLDPRITFTRATTATYYDGSTTTKAEQNFVLYSQNFSNAAWAVTNATKTSTTATDPAGGSTALTLTKTSNSDYSLRQTGIAPSASRTYTVSCWLKGTAGQTVVLYMDNGVDQTVIESTITLTSTWTRYSGTGTFNATNASVTCGIGLGRGGATATAVDIAFFQVEERSSVTAYVATTTQAVTNYNPTLQTASAGVARFDHNPVTGESLGLLIEASTTNLLTYSEDFSTAWTGPASIGNAAIVSPAGTLTGNALREATSSQYQRRVQVVSVSSGSTYTASVYAKKGSRDWLTIDAGPTAYYNLNTGTVGSVGAGATATMTHVGNGWYRCTYAYAIPTSTYSLYIGTSTNGSDGGLFTGTGYDSIYLWGAQLELGYFATSYIPTAAAAVTRNAESATMTGTNLSSWFNNDQGTLYAEQYITSVASGSINNQVAASLYSDSNNFIATGQGVGDGGGTAQRSSAWVQTNNSAQFFGFTGSFITANTTLKNAVAYGVNNFAYSANTQTLITDTGGTVPYVNTFDIGRYLVGSYYYANHPIRKVAFYPVRLTNTQLQALTS